MSEEREMDIGLYVLDGHTPVSVKNTLEWARWMERRNCVVKQEQIGAYFVSTVFLGVDHNHWRYMGRGRPLLFETMVFVEGEALDGQRRCSTWEEAEAQHERVAAAIAG